MYCTSACAPPPSRNSGKLSLPFCSYLTNPPLSQWWNDNFFTRQTLFDLGLSHQLGHNIDDPCSLPSRPISLVLFDVSGVHTIRVTYCFCNNNGVQSGNRRIQLLRAQWFPASWYRPGTAFTFRLLDFAHKLQTRSKVNLYDFYASLVSIHNSAGLSPPIVCSHFFMLFFQVPKLYSDSIAITN